MERGISIHIGVNVPAAMADYPLSRSEDAAWCMANLARQAGYNAIHVLRGPEATREAVSALMAATARVLGPGDTLFVSFSGHGSKVEDRDDDDRGFDETWCLYDDNLLDDELVGYWRLMPEGVRVVVVVEACYSGGNGRDAPPPLDEWFTIEPDAQVYRGASRGVEPTAKAGAPRLVQASEDACGIRASVLMLTATEEDQEAREGLYTGHLLKLWDGGSFRQSFRELNERLCEGLRLDGFKQEPQIMLLGARDSTFAEEVAFHLDRPVMRDGGGWG